MCVGTFQPPGGILRQRTYLAGDKMQQSKVDVAPQIQIPATSQVPS